MGGVANVVNSGLGMVTGGLAGGLVDRVGQGLWGGGGGGSAAAPAQQSAPPVPQRVMPQANISPYARQFIQGGQGYNSLPQGFNVTPMAWRGMQQPMQQRMQPNFNQNNYNPYQNMMMRQQQMQPTPYQNMGMFGAYNPYMPRR
jgi:hypothetical protein